MKEWIEVLEIDNLPVPINIVKLAKKMALYLLMYLMMGKSDIVISLHTHTLMVGKKL